METGAPRNGNRDPVARRPAHRPERRWSLPGKSSLFPALLLHQHKPTAFQLHQPTSTTPTQESTATALNCTNTKIASAQLDRHEKLPVLALHEERGALAGLADQVAKLLGRLERCSIEGQQQVAALDSRARRRPRDLLDHEPALAAVLAPFIGGERPHRDAEAPVRGLFVVGHIFFLRLACDRRDGERLLAAV